MAQLTEALGNKGFTVTKNGGVYSDVQDLGIASKLLFDMEMQAITGNGGGAGGMGIGVNGINYLTGALFVTNSGSIRPGEVGTIQSSFANAFHPSLNPKGGGIDVPDLLNYGMSVSSAPPTGMWHGRWTKGLYSRSGAHFLEEVRDQIGPAIEAAYGGKLKVLDVNIS